MSGGDRAQGGQLWRVGGSYAEANAIGKSTDEIHLIPVSSATSGAVNGTWCDTSKSAPPSPVTAASVSA